MLSSCRTVILHEDLVTPEPSLWRRRLYCSTMKSSDSLEICLKTSQVRETSTLISLDGYINLQLKRTPGGTFWELRD